VSACVCSIAICDRSCDKAQQRHSCARVLVGVANTQQAGGSLVKWFPLGSSQLDIQGVRPWPESAETRPAYWRAAAAAYWATTREPCRPFFF